MSPDADTVVKPSCHLHVVQFYDDVDRLLREVSTFLEEALLQQGAAIAIVEAQHRPTLLKHLIGAIEAGPHSGRNGGAPGLDRLLVLDAKLILDRFMIDGHPERHRFFSAMRAVINQVSQGGRLRVHAFGEMVAVLCAQGQHEAAVELERLWNELLKQENISLLCAYPLNVFKASGHAATFCQLCEQHSKVWLKAKGGDEGLMPPRDPRWAWSSYIEPMLASSRLAWRETVEVFRDLCGNQENMVNDSDMVPSDGRAMPFAHAPFPVAVTLGPLHDVQFANARFCQWMGKDEAPLAPMSDAWVSDWRATLDKVYESGIPEDFAVRVGTATDASCCAGRIHLEPLQRASGDVYGLIVIGMEVATSDPAADLEALRIERAKLIDDLNAANRVKDEFLAMLGHELRNPLSPIVTALQLMKMRGDTQLGAERAIIQRQVDHLVRLVDDLLDVSRLTRGRIALHKQVCNISALLDRAVDSVETLLMGQRHQIEIDIEPKDLRGYGDEQRLLQIVTHLLSNASRYTPPHGKIRLEARRLGQEIEIHVVDNGIGLAQDVLPNVFDLFFQGARGVDRAQGGLGLGLALVKNLAELHGGRVQAHSAGPGKGCEFVVYLPGALPDLEAVVDPTRVASATGESLAVRVLVVDDNVDAADSLGLLLAARGHEVRVAHDPVSALRMAREFAPTHAFLDIGLPVMDGYDLALQLKQRGLCPSDCRFVAVTGYGQEADRRRSAAVGFDVHVTKPVDPQLLAALLNRPS